MRGVNRVLALLQLEPSPSLPNSSHSVFSMLFSARILILSLLEISQEGFKVFKAVAAVGGA